MKKEIKIDISLTEEQRKHLKTIDWLLDFNENVATGRSYLLAIGFIRMAIKYPDRWIKVFDHFPTQQANERLLLTIKQIISEDTGMIKRAEFKQNEFRFNPLNPLK